MSSHRSLLRIGDIPCPVVGHLNKTAMEDTYRTIATTATAELKVEGSRFIGRAFHAATVSKAEAVIEGVRTDARDATHHCSAYRIDADTFRYDDDGEPSRTAGPPMLRQIDALGLVQTLVVVTRYYGGTNLGTGGLIRAYGQSAAEALAAASIATRVRKVSVHIRFAYPDTGPVMRVLDQFDAAMVERSYGQETMLQVAVRAGAVPDFRTAFVEATKGAGKIKRSET